MQATDAVSFLPVIITEPIGGLRIADKALRPRGRAAIVGGTGHKHVPRHQGLSRATQSVLDWHDFQKNPSVGARARLCLNPPLSADFLHALLDVFKAVARRGSLKVKPAAIILKVDGQ